MSTARVPQGATGKIYTLPAPGRPQSPHVSAGKWDKALGWFLALRRYQAQGYTFEEALEQAGRDSAPAPPGRAQQKGNLR
jgi:hypothetical protein